METAHTFMWISSFLFKYREVKELSGGMLKHHAPKQRRQETTPAYDVERCQVKVLVIVIVILQDIHHWLIFSLICEIQFILVTEDGY